MSTAKGKATAGKTKKELAAIVEDSSDWDEVETIV
jgi:hypothetical protein